MAMRQVEERALRVVWQSRRDQVSVAFLMETDGLQVLDSALWDVFGYQQVCGTSVHPFQWVVGRLEGPDGAVDEALLMPADDVLVFRDVQPGRDVRWTLDNFHLRASGPSFPALLVYEDRIGRAFLAAATVAGFGVG